MPRALPALLALVVVLVTLPGVSAAGFVASETVATDVDTPTTGVASSETDLRTSVSAQTNTTTNESDRPPISGLAFFTTYSTDAAPPFRIGFSATEDASGFFVLETADGEIVGKTDYRTFSGNVAVDGLPVPLTKPVHGVVNLTVTAYNDSDGDRTFDPAVDEPFRYADGEPVASSMWFVVPNRDGNVTTSAVSLDPPDPGATARHQFVLTAERDMTITSVAVDYRHTGIDLAPIDNASAGVGEVLPGKPTTRLDAARVEKPLTGVAVVYPAEPREVGDDERFFLNLEGLQNPPERTDGTILANPYGNGSATTVSLDIQPPGPRISPQGVVGDQTRIGIYDPEGARGFIVAKDVDGAVIGTVSLDPDREAHMDLGIDSFVEAEEREPGMTVELVAVRDSNGNGAFDPGVDEPYLQDGEAVAATVENAVFRAGSTTTVADGTANHSTSTSAGSSPTGTATTTPGFGVVGVVGALLALALPLRKR